MSKLTRKEARQRRHQRLRSKISGTASCPRLSVCFTGKNIHVQCIDDVGQRTLVAASTLCKDFKASGLKSTVEGSKFLGKLVAEKALAAGIQAAVFDRGGFRYHGRVAALADAAREAGLKF